MNNNYHKCLSIAPIGWEVKKLEEIAKFENGKAHEKNIDEDGNYIVVNSKFISSDGKEYKRSNKNLSPLEKGDITMVMSDVPNGKALAKCFLVNENNKFTLNQRICSIKAVGVYNEFLYFYLNRNKYYLAFDNGVGQTNLRKSEVLECPILLPPIKEQHKIVSIISSIDKALEKTEAIIKQTVEVKKGLMQQLLTKGIGHTKFKKTEIGEIPESWELTSLENVSKKIFVGIASSTTNSYSDNPNDVIIIRNQNILENKLNLKDVLRITREFSEANKNKKVKQGDLVTVRTGYPGITSVVPKELDGMQTFTTLITRLNQQIINPHFMAYYINSPIGKRLVTGGKAGGAQQNLNVAVMKKFKVVVPSIVEQNNIVSILSVIDSKIEKEQKKLSYLQTIKTGLMQSLLTGKVRVKVGGDEVTQV